MIRVLAEISYALTEATACLDPQNAEPVLFIVVAGAFDEAGQNFLGW